MGLTIYDYIIIIISSSSSSSSSSSISSGIRSNICMSIMSTSINVMLTISCSNINITPNLPTNITSTKIA